MLGRHNIVRSTIFSLMCYLKEIFISEFVCIQLGRYKISNLHDYIEHMRTPCRPGDTSRWSGFLENFAAPIMYQRSVHIHIMYVTPELKIWYYETHNERSPILLSYEGGNHYNALLPQFHQFSESRIGAQETMVLSNTVLGRTIQKRIAHDFISTEQLNSAFARKLQL